jgi:flavin reductase (DIM6/NTAB) family NADH-FMN oxidoreductase RutF/DNA-binding IclR family transcriptional regulator
VTDVTSRTDLTTLDGRRFREVLGHLPTGVAVVAARRADGHPVGMAVGSFTSVSLDPPLVAFLPDRTSTTWPLIKASGSFCASVLGDRQEAVCRAFAAKGGDKFAGIGWTPAPSGSPIIDGAVAYIDCDIETVHEAGDHFIVIGRVRELDQGDPAMPLVFLHSAYGRITPLSFTAWGTDLLGQMRLADIARPEIEALAAEWAVECFASAMVGDEIVVVADAGVPDNALPTRVGQRLPCVPPLGGIFMAWKDPDAVEGWLRRAGPGLTDQDAASMHDMLATIRRRGFSVGIARRSHRKIESLLGRSLREIEPERRAIAVDLLAELREDFDPPGVDADSLRCARSLAVPVFSPDGAVILTLNVHPVPSPPVAAGLQACVARLRESADQVAAQATGAPSS